MTAGFVLVAEYVDGVLSIGFVDEIFVLSNGLIRSDGLDVFDWNVL